MVASIRYLVSSIEARLRKLTEKQFLGYLIIWDFGFKLFRIWDPATPYFDEKPFYIHAARVFWEGNFTFNPEHPPLAKMVMATSLKLFGDNPLGWRLPSMLLGTVGVMITYFLAKRVTGSRRVAGLASLFLSFELGWFVSSRVATLEIYLASFLLLTAFFVIRLYQGGKMWNLLAAGLFLGAAFASKWSALLLTIWLVIFLLIFWKKSWLTKLASFSWLGIVIALIYGLSYLPYLTQHSLGQLVQLHQWMVWYHTKFIPGKMAETLLKKGYEFYPFPAWTWFLNPSFPYLGESFGRQALKAVLFFYNPIILWGGGASLLLILREQWRKIKPEQIFLLGAFLFQYLPWFLNPRFSLNYYLLPALPYFCIAFALVLLRFWKKNPSLVWLLGIGVVATFFLYYPLVSNLKVPYLYGRIVGGILEFSVSTTVN